MVYTCRVSTVEVTKTPWNRFKSTQIQHKTQTGTHTSSGSRANFIKKTVRNFAFKYETFSPIQNLIISAIAQRLQWCSKYVAKAHASVLQRSTQTLLGLGFNWFVYDQCIFHSGKFNQEAKRTALDRRGRWFSCMLSFGLLFLVSLSHTSGCPYACEWHVLTYLVTFDGGANTPWLGLQSKYLIPDTEPSFFPTGWSSSIPSHILKRRINMLFDGFTYNTRRYFASCVV